MERPLPVREHLTDKGEHQDWPKFSVIACSHNGSHRIGRCCEELLRLDYPDFAVIVVDDGSTDATRETAEALGIRVIRTPHGGLSPARNAALAAATGDLIAYIDDDAYPDPHWLRYLATTFQTSDCVGGDGPSHAQWVHSGDIYQCV